MLTIKNRKRCLGPLFRGVVASVVLGTSAYAQDLQELGFATSSSGGTGYMYAVAVATVVNENSTDIKITPFPSAGVIENDRLLRNDEAQIIIHTGGQAYSSYRGEGKYPSAFEDLRAVMPMYASLLQFIVPKDSDVKSPGDLAGKAVGLGAPGSSANTYARQVLTAEGVNDGDYDARPNSLTEQVAGLRDGNMDSLSIIMGAGAPALQDLATSRDVRWLSLSSETQKTVIANNPPGALAPVTIPTGTYPGQSSNVDTFGVPLWMMVRADMPDETVAEIVAQFLGNLDRALEVHPVVGGTTKDFVANAVPPTPWHPAAQAALKEAGYDSVDYDG